MYVTPKYHIPPIYHVYTTNIPYTMNIPYICHQYTIYHKYTINILCLVIPRRDTRQLGVPNQPTFSTQQGNTH